MLQTLDEHSDKYNIAKPFHHYIALCAIFPPEYNIIRNWNKHEEVFIEIVKQEGLIGIDHFMQALI